MNKQEIMEGIAFQLKSDYHTTPHDAKPEQLHMAVSKAIMAEIADRWQNSLEKHRKQRRAYYFSAEFLMGRMIYNNLMCLGMTKEVGELLEEAGASLDEFEDVED